MNSSERMGYGRSTKVTLLIICASRLCCFVSPVPCNGKWNMIEMLICSKNNHQYWSEILVRIGLERFSIFRTKGTASKTIRTSACVRLTQWSNRLAPGGGCKGEAPSHFAKEKNVWRAKSSAECNKVVSTFWPIFRRSIFLYYDQV